MSKLTNDSLTRSGTVYSCTHMATVGVEGLRDLRVAFKQVRTEPQSCLSIHLCAFWDALFSDVVSCCLVIVSQWYLASVWPGPRQHMAALWWVSYAVIAAFFTDKITTHLKFFRLFLRNGKTNFINWLVSAENYPSTAAAATW